MNAEPATTKQLQYYHALIAQRDITAMVKAMPDNWLLVMTELTEALNQNGADKVYRSRAFAKSDLTKFIGQLVKQRPKVIELPPAGTEAERMVINDLTLSDYPAEIPPGVFTSTQVDGYGRSVTPGNGTTKVNQPLQDGMYRGPSPNNHIYKVYHTVHGANVQVAKRLMVTDLARVADPDNPAANTGVKVKFKYEGKAPLKFLKPDMRLSLAEAAEFGRLYGVCCVCGITLTNELSIALGIGPICGKREFGGDFEFMVKQVGLDPEAAAHDYSEGPPVGIDPYAPQNQFRPGINTHVARDDSVWKY